MYVTCKFVSIIIYVIDFFCGNFRGKESGHDVDILITHEDDCIVEGLLVKLVERLDKLVSGCPNRC